MMIWGMYNMLNNRKQQIFSTLDSLTSTELEKYIQERKLNNKMEDLLNTIKSKKEPTHFQKLINEFSKNVSSIYEKYYFLGEAYILSYFLYNLCHFDFDTKKYKKQIIKILEDNQELKEMTYELMKDI
jgi:hypothetical protein